MSTLIAPDIYKPKPTTHLLSQTSSSAPTTPITKTTGMFKHLLGRKPKAAKSQAKAQAKGGKANVNPIVLDNVPISLKKHSKHTIQSSEVEKKKREVYAAGLPPMVVQEAQMHQAMEGGSLEYNIHQIMEEKAK